MLMMYSPMMLYLLLLPLGSSLGADDKGLPEFLGVPEGRGRPAGFGRKLPPQPARASPVVG